MIYSQRGDLEILPLSVDQICIVCLVVFSVSRRSRWGCLGAFLRISWDLSGGLLGASASLLVAFLGLGGRLGRHAGWEDRVVVRASYVLAVLEASWAVLGGQGDFLRRY